MLIETGRELDAAIAEELMGWQRARRKLSDPIGLTYPPSYSTDANAARLVLAEIERRGLRERFCAEFTLMVAQTLVLYSNDIQQYAMEFDWQVFTASPEAIGLAALAAVRGGKG